MALVIFAERYSAAIGEDPQAGQQITMDSGFRFG
jgi:hypothetical protein